MADVPMDDLVRSIVSPGNISYINGTLALKPAGLRQLATAVIECRIEGDPDAARNLLAQLEQQLPNA